ncbi:glycosyltransferase family 2 protein [Fibrobacter sp. UWB11]|uniref:glycosyltransferase family 2 protein n=1 Tax=Fibrobacter sp. UWB11 TaxID=1896202 RepID=UPI00094095F8|nr:glycosyltransferase family 2 protein [Fibrobacter sp. UWB11]
MKISLIIPTLNAGKFIEPLLKRLKEQTVSIDEIVIVDSASDDDTVAKAMNFDGVKVISIDRKNFNHGGTRDLAIQHTSGDFILCLTQDALPCDARYVERLIAPFAEDEKIAMASGRQVPREDASPIEKLTREFNYPEVCFVRSKDDIPRLGVKTFFASDCCSAFRRTAYEAIGGFDKHILINEDMKIAAQFIYAGYKIAYVGTAGVWHSHNYSLKQQYTRNFDVSAFMTMHPELFANISATSEGIKMVKWVEKKLLSQGRLFSAAYYIIESGVKFLANRRGRKFKKMSLPQLRKASMHKNYWV